MTMIKKDYQIMQKLGDDDYLILHPETNTDNVVVDINGISADNMTEVIEELKGAIDDKAPISSIPEVSQFITKAVDDLINYYTASVIDGKIADIESKVSAIPKFSIKVVKERPTTDINDTTIYLLKTGEDDENLYTEYIYINGVWETLGTQSLKLDGYAKEDWVITKISGYITEAKVKELIEEAAIKSAETADKLSTERKISISGDASGEATFDGSDDSDINITLSKTGVIAGVYSVVEVDDKGRVTNGSHAIEIGTAGQAVPSENLAIGGLFFKLI